MKHKHMAIIVAALLLAMAMVATGCSGKVEEDKSIIIAEQFGLAYAPIQIMKEKGFLDEALEGYDIQWVQLGNTTAIREAMLADQLDVGFVGIPPFLIGKDNGMDWKIISGLSSSPLGLVANDDQISSLEDILESDKIALPQPGSIQHILLSMAAERELGKADYFDEQLVSMKHPDGMSALLAGNEVSMHYTSPPYLFEELKEEDNHLVIDGNECFGGDFTFIVGMCREDFYNQTAEYEAFVQALEKSIDFMNENPEEALAILGNYYDYDAEILEDYIYGQGISYSSDINGLETFVDFMYRNGYLNNDYGTEDLVY